METHAFHKAQVLKMSLSFFGVFMAFNTAQSLATSILPGDLGNICGGTLYIVFTLACIPAASLVDKIGPRASVFFGAVPYGALVLTYLYPHPSFDDGKPSISDLFAKDLFGAVLSIVMFALVGLGAPVLWTGQGVYLGRCALNAAAGEDSSPEAATSYFNGLFWSMFQANGTVGNLIASIILQHGGSGDNAKRILFGVLGVCCWVGNISLVFLRQVQQPGPSYVVDRADSSEQANKGTAGTVTLGDAVRFTFTNTKMLLLNLLIFNNGMSLGFILADYTANWIKPALTEDWTGYIIATFYAFDTVTAYLSGKAASTWIGRRGVVLYGVLAYLSYWIFFLFWDHPTVETKTAEVFVVLFAGAAVFGTADAVFQTQLPAILQSYFQGRDISCAMSSLKLWQSLGMAAQFVLGFVLKDNRVKVIIFIPLVIVAYLSALYLDLAIAPLDQRGYSPVEQRDDHTVNHSVRKYNPQENIVEW
eukprot:TRINITY_DN25167_c0_g1_i1.p1 TRINITY_DN25167_c0_g1~~TRINITY_DN25167_c0_g1_i1.p1  ORF type:complete len:476 (+),score=124.71 TRINITY_DN25167_c0_g1_i1:79-1506(+)